MSAKDLIPLPRSSDIKRVSRRQKMLPADKQEKLQSFARVRRAKGITIEIKATKKLSTRELEVLEAILDGATKNSHLDQFPRVQVIGQTELERIEADQLELYKDRVLDRVIGRFSSRDDAERWFNETPIPGYGDMTAKVLVANGHAAWVIEAINAIDAGVYA